MKYEIDPVQWFSNRMLERKPAHFYVSKTSLTEESSNWIINKLKGRYSIVMAFDDDDFEMLTYPAFEDKTEAILYELIWS